MKYAFYPGCVSRGGTPELYDSTIAVATQLGIELEEIVGAACTGAGVLQEKGLKLGDALNARTFAMAERMGLTTIMTICSTCQGVMAQANKRLLDDPDYLAEINEEGALGIQLIPFDWLRATSKLVQHNKKNTKPLLSSRLIGINSEGALAKNTIR